ncbi:MAG: hypothetical protein PHX18_00230 [Candidatus Gastranaerophilales bacterium]|nr:hypothetical protein [Candidatus Gastranaerophilales bacterium]
MNQKLVHVDSYVKRDGTEVREHWRGRGPSSEGSYPEEGGMAESRFAPEETDPDEVIDKLFPPELAELIKAIFPGDPVYALPGDREYPPAPSGRNAQGSFNGASILEGEISVDVIPWGEILGSLGDAFGEGLGDILGVATAALSKAYQVKQKLDELNASNVSNVDFTRTHNALKKVTFDMDAAQDAVRIEKEKTLEKLVQTKNQDEYKKMYNKYMLQRDLYRKNEGVLRGVKTGVNNRDYEMVSRELSDYEENLRDFVQKSVKTAGVDVPKMSKNNPVPFKMNANAPNYKPVGNIKNVNDFQNVQQEAIPTELPHQNQVMNYNYESVPKNSFDIHDKNREYARLADFAGGYAKQGQLAVGQITPDGWVVRDAVHDKASNFKMVVYEKGDEIVIDYVGTDFLNAPDHGANLKAFFTGRSQQITQAIAHCYDVKKAYPDKKITVIGHSEGGTEAINAGLRNNLNVITYGALGVGKISIPDSYTGTIINYITPNDIVPKLKPNIGTTYVVEPNQHWVKRYTPLGIPDAHRLLFGYNDLRNPILVEDYLRRYLPVHYRNTIFTPAEREILIETWRQEGLKNIRDAEY